MDKDNTAVLLLKRKPEEIYKSFIRIGWREANSESKDDVMLRIQDHILAAESTLKKFEIPHIVIHYDDFHKRPDLIANRVSEFFSIKIAASDLGYDSTLNTSGFRGGVTKIIDFIGNLMPNKFRKALKLLVPKIVLKFIYPGRYSGK